MRSKAPATEFRIITEGYADKLLIKTLVRALGIGPVTRRNGCNAVVRHMETTLKDCFAFGVIDNDRVAVSALSQFKCILNSAHLKFHRHKHRPHYLLLLSQDVEDWIIAACQELSIAPSTYRLPDTQKELKHKTRHQTAEEDENLRSLFNQLRREGLGIETSIVNELLCVMTTVRNNKFSSPFTY
jgi:hypothetical protein